MLFETHARSSERTSMTIMWNWLLDATSFQILENLKKCWSRFDYHNRDQLKYILSGGGGGVVMHDWVGLDIVPTSNQNGWFWNRKLILTASTKNAGLFVTCKKLRAKKDSPHDRSGQFFDKILEICQIY